MATYNDSSVAYSSSTTTYNGDRISGGGNPWWVKQQPVTKKVE